MKTVVVDIPDDAIRLTGIVDIRNWLHNLDVLALDQFAIDWIEKYIDKANEFLAARGIEADDDTFRAATHYEVQTILQIMRSDAPSYRMFAALETRTRSKKSTD